MSKPKDPDFYRLLRNAAKEGLILIEEFVKSGKRIHRYEYFISGVDADSGTDFPNFSRYFKEEGPNDYKDVLGEHETSPIRIDKLESVKKVLEYAVANSVIKTFYTDQNPKYADVTVIIGIYNIVKALIDRYIHSYNRFDLVDRLFLKVYLPIENYIYASNLGFDVVIPILFLSFDFEKASFPQSKMLIERMSEKFQRARSLLVNVVHRDQLHTIGYATHAVVFKNWITEKPINDLLTTILFYDVIPFDERPKHYADCFFAALRIATDCNTGYAQVLLKPQEWGSDFVADLPDLKGSSLDRSLNYFRTSPVNRIATKLDLDQAKLSMRIFAEIIDSQSNKMRIAINRLNLCYERESQEDAILDATIAIEALLSDDNSQEITHKLALRIAALSKLDTLVKEDTNVIFEQVKQIYSFRSAVVHGSGKTKEKREIKLTKKVGVPTVKKGMEYLRMIIRVLLNHPRYQNAKLIDSELLLARKTHGVSQSRRNSSNTMKSSCRR